MWTGKPTSLQAIDGDELSLLLLQNSGQYYSRSGLDGCEIETDIAFANDRWGVAA